MPPGLRVAISAHAATQRQQRSATTATTAAGCLQRWPQLCGCVWALHLHRRVADGLIGGWPGRGEGGPRLGFGRLSQRCCHARDHSSIPARVSFCMHCPSQGSSRSHHHLGQAAREWSYFPLGAMLGQTKTVSCWNGSGVQALASVLLAPCSTLRIQAITGFWAFLPVVTATSWRQWLELARFAI